MDRDPWTASWRQRRKVTTQRVICEQELIELVLAPNRREVEEALALEEASYGDGADLVGPIVSSLALFEEQ